MWPREPQRYSVFSMKFVLNMKVSLHHLPLKAHKDSKNLACAVQGNQHKRTAEFEIVMTGIYKALQDLNPITSLISSATILSSPLLHPHCSLCGSQVRNAHPPDVYVACSPPFISFYANAPPLLNLPRPFSLGLQPPPFPKIAILFPLGFIFFHAIQHNVYFTYLRNICLPSLECKLHKKGILAFYGVFWSVFFTAEYPVSGIHTRRAVTGC